MSAESEKELQQLKKRILELARKSYEHNIYTYTGFLSMAEQDVFFGMLPELGGAVYGLFGGRQDCERRMLRFGSEDALGYGEDFPIVCLSVRPLAEKFADDMTHRDFLGAVMNLGIDRSTVGDILLEGKSAYLFCTDKIAPYLKEHLDRVKHTKVICRGGDSGEGAGGNAVYGVIGTGGRNHRESVPPVQNPKSGTFQGTEDFRERQAE